MLKNKIPKVSGLVTNTVFITKIWEVENKILHINRLVTNTTFITKMREIEKKKILMLVDWLLILLSV